MGIDGVVLGGRMKLRMEYLVKKRKELVVSGRSGCLVMGGSRCGMNGGKVRKKGLEFEVGWRDKMGDLR